MYNAGLTRTEILDLIKQQRTAILNIKTDSIHTNKHRTKAGIDHLQSDLQVILAALKSATTRSTNTINNPTGYKLILRQQSLCNAMRDIRKFEPCNDVYCYITNLNKAYTTQVKPELANYPRMEDEFVKNCQMIT